MLFESSIFLYLEFDVTFLSLSLRMYIFTNYALQYIYILFRCNSIFRDHHVRTISNISTEQNDRFRGPDPRTSNTLSLFSRKKQKQKCFFSRAENWNAMKKKVWWLSIYLKLSMFGAQTLCFRWQNVCNVYWAMRIRDEKKPKRIFRQRRKKSKNIASKHNIIHTFLKFVRREKEDTLRDHQN